MRGKAPHSWLKVNIELVSDCYICCIVKHRGRRFCQNSFFSSDCFSDQIRLSVFCPFFGRSPVPHVRIYMVTLHTPQGLSRTQIMARSTHADIAYLIKRQSFVIDLDPTYAALSLTYN